MKISEIKQIIREELNNKLNEFVSNQMGKGSSWKAGNKGYGAKNIHGVADYFYGEDEQQNREKAAKFSKDSTRKPVERK